MEINNFVYYNPTKIYFGDNQITHLGEETAKYGKKACLIYGGGSVIDAAKVVAQANFYEGDCWDLITKKVEEPRALPLIAIPTMASAGSENDAWAVISNADTNEKRDPWHAGYQPSVSFINPKITFTVSKYQTAVGAADIFSHIIEIRYLLKDHKIEFVSEMMEVMARNTVKYGTIAVNDTENVEARQNLSWLSAMITGGIMDMGGLQDMILHMTEYGIAAFFEIPHGHGIAILFPRWLQYILSEETAPIIYQLGKAVFDIENGLEPVVGGQKTIDAMSDWLYNKMGLESSLAKLGVTEDKLPEMAKKATENCGGVLHSITTLNTKDIENIFRSCM